MNIRLRLDFSYDGSAFHGYASQDGLRTVQGQLQTALKVFTREDIVLTVAGRTDSGVHASHQVVHFDIDPFVFLRSVRVDLLKVFSFDFSNSKAFLRFESKTNAVSAEFEDSFTGFSNSFSKVLPVFSPPEKLGVEFLSPIYRQIVSCFLDNLLSSDSSSSVGLDAKVLLVRDFLSDFDGTGFFEFDRVFDFALDCFVTKLNNVLAMLDKSAYLHGVENKAKSDIVVFSARLVTFDFDARFSALCRKYVYTISDLASSRDVFRRNSVLWFDDVLNVDLMNKACVLMLGEFDFLSFCKPREGATTVRTLKQLRVCRNAFGEIEVFVVADAFCHSMVRSIVGVLLLIGQGARPVSWGRFLLDNPSRSHSVSIAPSHGLALIEVVYPPVSCWGVQALRARGKRSLGGLSDGVVSENCCE